MLIKRSTESRARPNPRTVGGETDRRITLASSEIRLKCWRVGSGGLGRGVIILLAQYQLGALCEDSRSPGHKRDTLRVYYDAGQAVAGARAVKFAEPRAARHCHSETRAVDSSVKRFNKRRFQSTGGCGREPGWSFA
jgi:hypothetical protein